MAERPKKGKTTQGFVPIKEIRDGIAMDESGALHMVLMASSLNFALRSMEEQEAIITQYQNFLNSLDFSVQITVQSRRLNINPYLDSIQEKEKEQTNELLKIQTREYMEFVKGFVETAEIVKKSFYVTVTYVPAFKIQKRGITGIFNSLFGSKNQETNNTEEKFEEHRGQLFQRVNTVSSTLNSAGVKTVPLNTEEMIELYYGLFNPGELEKGHMPQARE